MTIVISRKYKNGRMVVLSDSMIGNPGGTRDSIMPGRLKSIVLNQTVSISYAGLSDPALSKIRELKKTPDMSTDQILNSLVCSSRDLEIDYILNTHEFEGTHFKISKGKVFSGSDIYWIGDPTAFDGIFALFENNQIHYDESMAEETILESRLSHAFNSFIQDGGVPGVGGVTFNMLASPNGHCYQNHASSFSWDTIEIGPDTNDYQPDPTGMYHFNFNIYSADERGVAVVGLYLDQAGKLFIYSPLSHDDPIIFNASHQTYPNLIKSFVAQQRLE